MAKETVVHITDDLDGAKDATEVAFSYQGTDYTIDLSKKNAAALEKALKPYLDAATKVGKSGGGSRRQKSSTSPRRRDFGAIRKWAHENGIEVSERGRVAASVIEQYEAAH